jgi:hypothetical protein
LLLQTLIFFRRSPFVVKKSLFLTLHPKRNQQVFYGQQLKQLPAHSLKEVFEIQTSLHPTSARHLTSIVLLKADSLSLTF